MSIYIKTSKGAASICTPDLRHLNAKNNWKTYSNNGWTMDYVEVYNHIFFVKGSTTIQNASDYALNQLVMNGNPITPLVDTTLPMLVVVGNAPVGYGNVFVSTNTGVYLNSTSYGAAHSYLFYGYLVS